MCELSEFIVLSEIEECQITYCKMCNEFSIIYKACCTSLPLKKLNSLLGVLEQLTYDDYRYDIMGQRMVIIRNPQAYIGFCLTIDDTEQLINCIKEAKILFEAYQIIYN